MSEHEILSKIYGHFINRRPEDIFRYVAIIKTYYTCYGEYVVVIYYFSLGRTKISYQFFLFNVESDTKVRLVSSTYEYLVKAHIPEDIKDFDALETVNYVPIKRIMFNIAEKDEAKCFLKDVLFYLRKIVYGNE